MTVGLPRSAGPVAVATGPVDVRLGDVGGNLARIADVTRAAVADGARVVVLPELATSGYVFGSRDECRDSAITADDPRLRALAAALPPDGVLVVGFAERAADRLYSSAAVVGHGGVLAVYRKTHLWGDEADFFAPGDRPPPVVDTPVGRIGVAVCYDAEFPEVPRGLALAGADLLALPVNWPLVPRPAGEHPPETVLAMAAARASRLPVVIADRVGTERGVEWTGGSAVIGADGWILAHGQTAELVTAVVDPDRSRDKRIGARNDLLADRRPELYRSLTRGAAAR
ncbi:nitrilase-related carbon-nitrogen hydrolase [Promicromonospora sp. NPDC050880]|uniref:nitrilase-related carbon-nitrogen hydrolase n=1 Tax=Promicromonospora sp. NPDC050880 TaxID=3364406 RepID=UPI0037876E27